MPEIKVSENFESEKKNLEKLYTDGLVGTYHVKDKLFSKSAIKSEPQRSFRDSRQIDNFDKFKGPLDLYDEEINYYDPVEEDCGLTCDVYVNKPANKEKDLDHPDIHPGSPKDWLDAGSIEVGAPVMFIAEDA